MPNVQEILSSLQDWAPAASAQSYDNVGLQIGDRAQDVTRVMVALDLTRLVLDEAINAGAELIVTHHPLIFRPVRSVTATDDLHGIVYHTARAGISHIAVHTNLDAARDGVSFALARTLSLQDIRFISGMPEVLQKLIVFVPASHADEVRTAIAQAGGGVIGEYDSCAFATVGTGYFRAGEAANPYIGTSGGGVDSAEEVRLEVEVPKWLTPKVVAAMKHAHPYDEVAYDVVNLQNPSTRHGLGAVGTLREAAPLSSFLDLVSKRLGCPSLRYAGRPDQEVRRVAVCGGSGSSFLHEAMASGADTYVTADITYHTFFDVLNGQGEARMALIDAGHYETEAMTETILVDYLKSKFETLEVARTTRSTNPVRYWTRDSSHEIKS
jgi:dinuclear metal center YbgI/SA1388 family protein